MHTGFELAAAGFSHTDQEVMLARTDVPGFSVAGSEGHTFANNTIFQTPLGYYDKHLFLYLCRIYYTFFKFSGFPQIWEMRFTGSPFRQQPFCTHFADMIYKYHHMIMKIFHFFFTIIKKMVSRVIFHVGKMEV